MRVLAMLLLLSLFPVFAQIATESLEERLRVLEAKAANADALSARVVELETKLEQQNAAAEEARLETAVSGLIDEKTPVVAHSRKAKSLVIGGQLRLRTEYRTVNLYGAENPKDTDEDFTILRTRVNFDARLLDHVRAFVEIQDSRVFGEELGVLNDLEGVDLHQGFVDFEHLFGSDFTFRAGRFELSLWNQRLISPLDWHPVSRSWDGILIFGKAGDWHLWGGFHAIAEDPVVDSDKDTDLYWVSATYAGVPDHEFGGAFFWLHTNTGSADFSFGTATLHAQGKFGSGFDYSADGVIQFGDNEERDVHAHAWAATFGYTFAGDWKPRLGLEWTFATGDKDPTDDEFETFNPLFPFGHFYQGYLDIFAWINGHDLAAHFECRPAADWWAEIAFHAFLLDSTNDSWFNAGGLPIRTSLVADHHEVGYELDLSFKHWLSPDVWFWFGYSHFFAGDYVEDTGKSPDTDWLWLQLTANF